MRSENVEGSEDESDLAPRCERMASVCQIGWRRPAIRSAAPECSWWDIALGPSDLPANAPSL